jgi:two-component system, cell cycle sensor histidine kinase and response regulator CckA
MDIRIQGPRDGIQTTEILKKQFDVPVVYLTAHADEATIDRAKLTEPSGYLLKPVKSAELRSCIEVALFKHQMERRLRAREHWFSTTLRSIADAVVTVDIAGKVTFMNPTAEALIGLPAADAMGKSAREVFRIVDEQSAKDDETPLDRALRGMQPVQLKGATLLNLDTGAQRLINDSAAPVVDEKSTLGAVMVFRDVTEDKKLEKRLEFAYRLASLGTMAAGVAHELNNPLTVIIANAAMVSEDLERHRASLMAGASPQETSERLDEIAGALRDLQSAANRMERIISDLRIFSLPAPETSGLIDLAQCVQREIRAISNEFRHRARLVTRFGKVSLVKADESRLGQVVVNLLVNAAQSIPPGNADRNEISLATYTNDDGRAVLEVRDTGAGIPSDALPRIFEPFFTTKDASTGTGLGLSICHGIVNSIGGEITVNSQVGEGHNLPCAAAARGDKNGGHRRR